MTQQLVQDFRPLTDTLEWRLADVHWSTAGVLPFAGNQVPYIINNSGRLAQCAAAIFHTAAVEGGAAGPLWALELGAGCGLFALQFLDALRALCAQRGTDVYARTRYVVTDRSERTVQGWAERGIFQAHAERVLCGTCDALQPTRARLVSGEDLALEGLQAVFLNYLLDNLPGTVLRREGAQIRELQVRTNLIRDAEVVHQYTGLDAAALRRLAESADPEEQAQLIPLLTLLEPEVAFAAVDPAAIPYGAEALAACPAAQWVLVSHGALRCLEGCLGVLAPRGVVLVHDYGPTREEEVAQQTAPLRFGSTMALGINFPLVEALLAGRCAVLTPSGDAGRRIHARLLTKAALPETAACLEEQLGTPGQDRVAGPAEAARQHLRAGRIAEARAAYEEALVQCPQDWWVEGELAELLVAHLRDPAAGLAVAQRALQRNPWYSAWLWNVLGDCLFGLSLHDQAHQAYLQASQIDPEDARAHLNLSYTWSQRGQLAEALAAIARGLARDRGGAYRARLLDKQQHVLAALSTRELGEQERHAQRLSRLRCDLLGE